MCLLTIHSTETSYIVLYHVSEKILGKYHPLPRDSGQINEVRLSIHVQTQHSSCIHSSKFSMHFHSDKMKTFKTMKTFAECREERN